jgi:hypothetical protein
VVVEDHEETLMQFMILCKLGLAAPEVHLATTIIIHLHFIWSSSSRLFAQDGLTEFTPIHKFSELERNTLLLMALSTSDIKEGEKIDMRRRRSIARSSICIHNLVSNRRGRLRFVLTPQWAAGHRFMGMADDEATMDKSLGLFLLSCGRPRPCFSITAPAYRLITSASAIRRSASQEENHR